MNGHPIIRSHLNLETPVVSESGPNSVKEIDVDPTSVIDLDVDCAGTVTKRLDGLHESAIGNEAGASSSDHTRVGCTEKGITLKNLAVAKLTALILSVDVAVEYHGAESRSASIGPKRTGD